MQAWLHSALVAGALALSTVPAAAEVHLTIADGYVSLDAKDATVGQILSEWARVGQTRVVNGERIAGPPLTLQLLRVPEAEALDILLRSVSGYLAAPRADVVANASRFDRILVMPTSTPPRVVAPTPVAQQPFQPQMPPDDADLDEPVNQPMPVAGPPGRGPIFPQYPNPNPTGGPAGNVPQRTPAFQPQGNPFPQNLPFPQGGAAAPAQGIAPPAVPGTMPVGVSTPGMVVQPPAQPGGAPDPQQ